MRLLISGGCKNGKSSIAEHWIAAAWRQEPSCPLYYLATMIPRDREDQDRILTHRRQRQHIPFTTVELGRQITRILDRYESAAHYLLDSTTALLANEMFPDTADGQTPDWQAGERVATDLVELAARLENLVIVSDYLYSDAVFYDPQTEAFRCALAQIDRRLATVCEVVVEVSCGRTLIHKGLDLLNPDQIDLLQGLPAVQNREGLICAG